MNVLTDILWMVHLKLCDNAVCFVDISTVSWTVGRQIKREKYELSFFIFFIFFLPSSYNMNCSIKKKEELNITGGKGTALFK